MTLFAGLTGDPAGAAAKSSRLLDGFLLGIQNVAVTPGSRGNVAPESVVVKRIPLISSSDGTRRHGSRF